MAPDGAELLIAAVTVAMLFLAPLASKLIGDVGAQVSAELDGGRSGASLARHLDRNYEEANGGEGRLRELEVRQLIEARAYLKRRRGEEPPDSEAEFRRVMAADTADAGLRAEVRELVLASNERRRRAGKPPLDVDVEVGRRLRDAAAPPPGA